MYLAIGFSSEHEGFCASRGVETDITQEVANSLYDNFGIYFDQILLVINDADCPTVKHHWQLDRDYTAV